MTQFRSRRSPLGGESTPDLTVTLLATKVCSSTWKILIQNSVGASVYGVSRGMLAKASGIGTVRIITQVNYKEVELFVHDVLFVENVDHGLFSMQMAFEQGFEIDFERSTCTFIAKMQGQEANKESGCLRRRARISLRRWATAGASSQIALWPMGSPL
ncbi:hypothetical protein CCR75_008022 [Bremia lactucae]|uniref:Uncharacterized protein n=1 Tax=Bremia lactucae TaxID=4779 RepID=A0A976FQV5_BRELC|nr:hypothetical protein CCR75_008022 [Bremia lactucae]